MVLYPIETLKSIGVTEILIITGGDNIGDFAEFLGDGSGHGVDLTYRVQAEAGGIAEALLLAKGFTGNQDFWVILGDNVYGTKDFPIAKLQKTPADEFHVVLAEVEDNKRFGVPIFGFDGATIVDVIEKPKDPPNKMAVTGLYHYPPEVYGIIRAQVVSSRGELEISDTNRYAAERGLLGWTALTSFWSDCGTPESLAHTTRHFLDNPEDSSVSL